MLGAAGLCWKAVTRKLSHAEPRFGFQPAGPPSCLCSAGLACAYRRVVGDAGVPRSIDQSPFATCRTREIAIDIQIYLYNYNICLINIYIYVREREVCD